MFSMYTSEAFKNKIYIYDNRTIERLQIDLMDLLCIKILMTVMHVHLQ